jgi:hypothetical protein
MEETGRGVGGVAFLCDTGVPVMVGCGGFLGINQACPWIFSRGLVKMPVKYEVVCHMIILIADSYLCKDVYRQSFLGLT